MPLEDIAEESEDIFALWQFHPPAENPESSFRRRELRASLDAAIRSLRPLYRDVFILRAIKEHSTSETARALRLTTSTVKTRLRRARVELRNTLAKAWAPPETLAAVESD